LEGLRASFGKLVDRQRSIWDQERPPDNPSGGHWETGAQPRLFSFEGLIDADTTGRTRVFAVDPSRQLCRVTRASELASCSVASN
jgi:hypothetical protein